MNYIFNYYLMSSLQEIISAVENISLNSRLFGNNAGLSNTDFIFYIFLFTIIGFISITVRYTLNYIDEKEYKKWRDENWLTKVFLSILVGGLSYLFVIVFISLIGSIIFAVTGTNENQFTKYFVKDVLFGNVLLAVAYGSGILYLLSKRGRVNYKDITKFSLFNVYAVFILSIWSLPFFVIRNSLILFIMGILFSILLTWLAISPFLIKRNKIKLTKGSSQANKSHEDA